jgi:hypothetical protein
LETSPNSKLGQELRTVGSSGDNILGAGGGDDLVSGGGGADLFIAAAALTRSKVARVRTRSITAVSDFAMPSLNGGSSAGAVVGRSRAGFAEEVQSRQVMNRSPSQAGQPGQVDIAPDGSPLPDGYVVVARDSVSGIENIVGPGSAIASTAMRRIM